MSDRKQSYDFLVFKTLSWTSKELLAPSCLHNLGAFWCHDVRRQFAGVSAGHVSARLPGLLRSGRSFGAARHVVQTQLSPVVGVPPGTTREVSPLLVSVFCCLHAQANYLFFFAWRKLFKKLVSSPHNGPD